MSAEARQMIAELAAANDHAALHELGGSFMRSGEYPLAEEAFGAAVAAGSPWALAQQATALDYMGRTEEAESLYRGAIAAGEGWALVSLADMIRPDPDRAADAEDLLRRGIAEQVPTAHFVLGQLLARQAGREAEAEAELNAETEPAVIPYAQLELAQVLRRQPGRGQDFERALRASGTADAEFLLSRYLWDQPGRRSEAVDLMRRAAEVRVSGAWNSLAVMLTAQGRDSDAEAAYRDGINAGEAELFVYYGQFLIQRGRSAEAENILRLGLPHDRRCGYPLGVLLTDDPSRRSEGRGVLVTAAGAGVIGAALHLGTVPTL